jgi:hypothetical protein
VEESPQRPDETQPGKFRVELIVLAEGDEVPERLRLVWPEGEPGVTLSELRENLGGAVGTVKDPLGHEHRLSVEHLNDFDAGTTRCVIHFVFEPDDAVAFSREAKVYLQDALQMGRPDDESFLGIEVITPPRPEQDNSD